MIRANCKTSLAPAICNLQRKKVTDTSSPQNSFVSNDKLARGLDTPIALFTRSLVRRSAPLDLHMATVCKQSSTSWTLYRLKFHAASA